MTEPKRFFELLRDSEHEVIDARLVNDETVEVHFRNDEEFEEQNNSSDRGWVDRQNHALST